MSFIEIQYLVALFFIVNDLRNLFDHWTFKSMIRIIAGLILLILCVLRVSIVR